MYKNLLYILECKENWFISKCRRIVVCSMTHKILILLRVLDIYGELRNELTNEMFFFANRKFQKAVGDLFHAVIFYWESQINFLAYFNTNLSVQRILCVRFVYIHDIIGLRNIVVKLANSVCIEFCEIFLLCLQQYIFLR